jgi:hypothetical protein
MSQSARDEADKLLQDLGIPPAGKLDSYYRILVYHLQVNMILVVISGTWYTTSR